VTISPAKRRALAIADNKIARWVELDLAYIDHWSLMLDVWILFRTMPGVVARTGQ